MSHANAALTPRTRLRLARLVVDQGWTCASAAKMFMVAARTATKWADRYRAEGVAGMADRSSRPHRCPTKTPEAVKKHIVRLRWRHRLGPVQIGGRLALPASTVHAVLVRCRINRLSRIDRVSCEPLRRYEHDHPGSLIHVDVTKFGNIPDGGGWRYVGKQQGKKNKSTTALRTGRTAKGHPNIGTAFLHTVIDDHSRVAYVEICADEKATTAIGSCAERSLGTPSTASPSNASCPTTAPPTGPTPGASACADLAIKPKRTRPYRPQTNGKIERFHRTLADGWAYARFYGCESDRRAALPSWLHFYNHHRPHSATAGKPPVSRLTNLPGHHI